MKRVSRIVGIGLISVLAVHILLNKKEENEDDVNRRNENAPVNFPLDNTVPIINQDNIHRKSTGFEDVKYSAAEIIHNRHEEASNIMKEAVDIIYKRSEISEDENHDLEQLSDELDKLLGEE